MDTRRIAAECRLGHWSEILLDRQASGESIKGYCVRTGIRENVYYYWQRKLREAACQELMPAVQPMDKQATVPNGWAVCTQNQAVTADCKPVIIEIGKCRIEVASDTDADLLTKVCGMLMALC